MEKELTLQDILKTIEADLADPSIISDNKLIFSYDGNTYRTRMPSQLEESIAQNEKNILFGKLIMTEGYYFKDKLKQILKEKQGVDIDAMEYEKTRINMRIQDAQITLAPKQDDEQKAIETLRSRIIDLQSQRIELSIKINQYLSCSIEDNMEKIYIQSLTAHCTEILEVKDDKEVWIKVWKDSKEFQDDSSLLASKAMAYMSYLVLNVR